jgi:Icc-related predicted phosphoesterase
VEGIKIFGCQWRFQPKKIVGLINILLTHRPPCGTLLVFFPFTEWTLSDGQGDLGKNGERFGSEELATKVKSVSPQVHVFGHNHGHSFPNPLH